MEKTKSVCDVLMEVVEEMCDKYCKFPDMYTGNDEDELYEKHCDNCPMNKLI